MDPRSQFKRYLLYSFCFHLVVFILFLILAERASIRKIPETKITMVRLAPRLGTPEGAPEAPPGIPEPAPKKSEEPPLPEVRAPQPKSEPPPVAEKKPAPKPPAVKPVPKPKPQPAQKPSTSRVKVVEKTPTVKTKKVAKPDEGQIANALAGIDRELEDREKQLQEPPPPTAGNPGTPNAGQPGLGTPQGTVTARDPGYAQYQSLVRGKIVRNWVRTHAGSETEKLSARIRVRINAGGAVISKTFARRSGDAAFDNSALRAVERASPFPPPPPEIKQEALREGFVVDFRSRVIGRN